MNTTCGRPRDDAFHILRDPVHSDLPWPGVIIRSTLCSLWYWCTDQVIVQRTLAAKNLAHARGATIIAGYLKILPLFLIIIPGMISRVLFTEEVACVDPEVCKAVCDNAAGCSNIAYPKLVLDLAPVGLKGLLMAVMMSALISSLTSVFNSAATLFTMDIWTKYRKRASEKELLIIGRLFVVFLVGVSIAWIPLIKSSEEAQLFFYIQKVTGYIAPPVCAIYLLAVLIPFINEKGAFWGMLTGQMLGITRLVLDFVFTGPKCGEPDLRPDVVSKFHFTYFSSALFGFTAIVTILISVFTKRPTPSMLNGLTIWSVHRFGLHKNRMTLRRKRIMEGSTRSDVSLHRHHSYDRPYSESIGLDNRYSTLTSTTSSYIGTQEEEMRERHKEMLTIPSTAKIFLNVNAILLLSVFIMCYAIFG